MSSIIIWYHVLILPSFILSSHSFFLSKYFFRFAYDITEEDADDVQAVCQVVQNLTAQGVSGNNFNDQESEMFDFQSWSGSSASKKSAGAISAAVIGTLLAVTAIAGAAVYFWNVETADSKKTPLMEPNAGTVA